MVLAPRTAPHSFLLLLCISVDPVGGTCVMEWGYSILMFLTRAVGGRPLGIQEKGEDYRDGVVKRDTK